MSTTAAPLGFTPAACEAFQRYAEKLRRSLDLVARAYAASPRGKKERSKAELLAVLEAHAPARSRALWAPPAQPAHVTLSELLPRLEPALVNSHGPHAPPARSRKAERLRIT
jgi:hypothetical protein